MDLKQFSLAFIGMFVALDVIGTLPIYASMTHDQTTEDRRRTLNTAMLVAFIVATVFLFLGVAIFKHLGISLYDFKIAGGLVLLLLALADLVGASETEKRVSGSSGVVPLAVPLITGPAVLTTLVLQAKEFGWGMTLFSVFLNYLFAFVLLRQSGIITRLLGRDGTMIISKIASLLLAAIAVSMIRSGIVEAFPRLGGL